MGEASVVTLLKKRSSRFSAICNFFTPILGLDKRSLAVWRFFLGIITFGDLVNRSLDLHAHYTDLGITSRADTVNHWSSSYYFVIHFANGHWMFQALLFSFHMYCALMFAIGYRTKLFNFLTWVLVLSLQSFAPYLGHGGDQYHRILLFWSLFLPVSEYWSVDALNAEWKEKGVARDQSPTKENNKNAPLDLDDIQYLSMGSVGLLSHLFFCYTFSTYHKTGPEWLVDGTATFYALNLDFFQLPLARLFLQLPSWVLQFLSFGTFWWEYWGAFFMVVPFKTAYFRIFASVAFAGMHAGFGSCLRLGLFFWITTFNFIAYLPPLVWETFLPWIATRERTNFKVYYKQTSEYSCHVAFFLSYFLLKEVDVMPISTRSEPQNRSDGESGSIHIRMESDSHIQQTPNRNALLLVETNDAKTLTNWKAFVYCCQHTLLLRWLGTILLAMPLRIDSFLSHHFEETASFFSTNEIQSIQSRKNKKKNTTPFYLTKAYFIRLSSTLLLQFFLFYIMYLSFCWNVSNIGGRQCPLLEDSRWIVHLTRMDQQWNMFSPGPPKASFFYTIPAELVNGKKVELWRDGAFFSFIHNEEIIWDPPTNWKASFRSHRWFKFWENGFNSENSEWIRLSTGRFICREFNGRYPHNEKLWTFQIYYNTLFTDAEGTKTPGEKQLLWSHQCFEKKPEVLPPIEP